MIKSFGLILTALQVFGMTAQWRIEYPVAFAAPSRCNGRQDIFLADHDRHSFTDPLQAFSERYAIDMHHYVLMGHH